MVSCVTSLVSWLLGIVLGTSLLAVPQTAAPQTAAPSTNSAGTHPVRQQLLRGADISWPNCPKGMGIPGRRSKGEPMPRRTARFVVVGVTNGPGFYPNPCIGAQVAWVRSHHRLLGAYAMTTYPRRKEIRRYGGHGPYAVGTRLARLRNTAYDEAVFNANTMQQTGLQPPRIWVDVEPYPTSPWTRHHSLNRVVVSAAIRGYHDLGYRVGLYTYANGWHDVVGRWHLSRYPAWVTAGPRGAGNAAAMCRGRGPTGGRVWLAQWWSPRRDYDLRCAQAPRRAGLTR